MDLPSSVQETNLTVRLLINHWLVWIFWPLRTSTNSLAVYASQPPIFLSTGICNVPSAACCTAQQPGSIYSTCSSSSKMERTLFICHMSYAQWTVFNWQAYPLIGFQTREANPNPFLLKGGYPIIFASNVFHNSRNTSESNESCEKHSTQRW